jgi:8-oxo-dGTP pyrophosphatase MutT (NUDIX family)
MRQHIIEEIESIEPLDSDELAEILDVLSWIESSEELCRTAKPATPKKHLVSYFVVVDNDHLLLVDHINAQKWLPTGGHVEPGEHPKDTVVREANEELGLTATFLHDNPLLVSSVETVGLTAGHTDVTLWYALKGDMNEALEPDPTEFNRIKWFHRNQIPNNTDPYLPLFIKKLYASGV